MLRSVDTRLQLHFGYKLHTRFLYRIFQCICLFNYVYSPREGRFVLRHASAVCRKLPQICWFLILLPCHLYAFVLLFQFSANQVRCDEQGVNVRYAATVFLCLQAQITFMLSFALSQQPLVATLNSIVGNWRAAQQILVHKLFERVHGFWFIYLHLRAVRWTVAVVFSALLFRLDPYSALSLYFSLYPILYELTLQLLVLYMQSVEETFVCFNDFLSKKLQTIPPNRKCLHHAVASASKLHDIGMETLRQYRDACGKIRVLWVMLWLNLLLWLWDSLRVLVVHFSPRCRPIFALPLNSIIMALVEIAGFKRFQTRLQLEASKFVNQVRDAATRLPSSKCWTSGSNKQLRDALSLLLKQIDIWEILCKTDTVLWPISIYDRVSFKTVLQLSTVYLIIAVSLKPVDRNGECSVLARFDYINEEHGFLCRAASNTTAASGNDTLFELLILND